MRRRGTERTDTTNDAIVPRPRAVTRGAVPGRAPPARHIGINDQTPGSDPAL
jgi:hypothetical protein